MKVDDAKDDMGMLKSARDFVFRDVYEYIALVEACTQEPSTLAELCLEENRQLALGLYRPRKLGLLNQYIFTMIRVEQTREYRKNLGVRDVHDVGRFELLFREYGVPFIPFSALKSHVTNDCFEADDPFLHWFLVNEKAFLHYWEKVADEVFHISFYNRRLLLQFGLSLAEYVSWNPNFLPEEILSKKGYIRRYGRMPAWLRKAIFYRDHGRCVSCRKDLSGLLSTDRYVNLDHIVPLARWGSNDPSNFQLLCDSCNLEKSEKPAWTGRFYVPWWDY